MRRLFVSLIILVLLEGLSKASMNKYCATPPFITQQVPPNILIVMDVSGSMQFPAYGPCQWDGYNDNKVAQCGTSEVNYDPSKKYYGYFKTNKYYEYSSNKFVENDSCSSTGPDCIPGNLLNWATMTRIDVLRKVLIGGKSVSTQYNTHTLEGEGGNWVFKDSNLHCKFKLVRGSYPELAHKLTIKNYKGACVVGTLSNAKIRVDVPDRERRGVIQNISDKNYDGQWDEGAPRFGLMIFSSDREGCMRAGIGTVTLSDFLNAVQSAAPYNGTPTGEALTNALDYFKQDKSYKFTYSCSGNNAYIGGPGSEKDPWTHWCQKSFILLLSDGEWNGNVDPVKPAREGHLGIYRNGNYDLRSDLRGSQTVSIYTVYSFSDTNAGRNSMQQVAIYGGFKDLDNNHWPYPYSTYPTNSRNVSLPNASCNPNGTYNDECKEWDQNGDGLPDNYFEAQEGSELERKIMGAISDILKQTSSGTAASVVSTSEEHGANILQALFWPKRYFDNNTSINWSGTLYNLWMYIGPFAVSQEIRENSDSEGESDSIKNLTLKDKVIQFYTDNSTGETKITVCNDLNGSGKLTNCDNESLSYLKTVWDAGKRLWETPPSEREIFTDVDNLTDNATEGNFISSNASVLMNYLDVDNLTLAQQIIKWTRGYHIDGLRDRVVTIGTQSHVWKLGDIINSTPQVLSVNPVNRYYEDYKDKSYYEFNFNDNGTFRHKNRGMVFVGANDGMLHAFRLGALSFPGGNIIAQLKENGGPFGSEAWAFIPKNVLPYLKYMSENDYCHIYSVDLTPYLFDASIGDPEDADSYGSPGDNKTKLSWRTILIGGFNLGGGCGNNATGAIKPPNDTGNVPSGIGRSSYFALDVTDPEDPKVLWEFSDKDLAFTTTGPAIIHIPYKKTLDNGTKVDDTSKNGYWYVAFASGPDNYDGTVHQPLYLYVLDLKTGRLKRKMQLSGTTCTVGNSDCFKDLIGGYNAFAGRMFSSVIDLGENYSDDAFYFGYNYDTQNGWKGGIIRVNTLDDPDVDHWEVSRLIKDIGPITAAVRELEDRKNNNLWIYFGEGRYFTKGDDPSSSRNIYGVKDPCYESSKLIKGCETILTLSNLDNVTNDNNADVSGYDGWYITLVHSGSEYDAERVITDPIASSYGWVFFTTFMPTGDLCEFGGRTYLWMVNYSNGGSVSNLSGKIFLQTSTGAINEIYLSKSFGKNLPDTFQGRRDDNPYHGRSHSGSIFVPPKPLAKTIQWLED